MSPPDIPVTLDSITRHIGRDVRQVQSQVQIDRRTGGSATTSGSKERRLNWLLVLANLKRQGATLQEIEDKRVEFGM